MTKIYLLKSIDLEDDDSLTLYFSYQHQYDDILGFNFKPEKIKEYLDMIERKPNASND